MVFADLPAARTRLGLLALVGLAACGRDRVDLIGELPEAGQPIDGGLVAGCPQKLADRLTTTTIGMEKSIAWRKPGYDGFPADERIAMARQPNGKFQIAWAEVNPSSTATNRLPPQGVHVTLLDENFVPRVGDNDTFLSTALEVSGLVAHDDGFAVLTRDQNQGTKIDRGDGATVAYLVRYQNGQQKFSIPLTGSLSADATESYTLYSPKVDGQLTWNPSTSVYGAYFTVEGGIGDVSEGFWRDALVFRDAAGAMTSWKMVHGCSNNGGSRLIVDNDKVNLVSATWPKLPALTGLCVQQSDVSVKFTAMEQDRQVSSGEVHWSGYSGAKMGSLLKTADGYLVFWLSLGSSTADKQGHGIRMARLDKSFNLVSGPTWVTQIADHELWNLHVVPYGSGFLMIYLDIAITGSPGTDYAVFVGNLVGMHLGLIGADGALAKDELVAGVAITSDDEPLVLSESGDIVWPFVDGSPDYSDVIRSYNGPGQTDLHVARLKYCQ